MRRLHAPGQIGYSKLEDGLRNVDGNGRILHDGLLLPNGGFDVASDFGTTMPVKSWEESIPSVNAPHSAVTALVQGGKRRAARRSAERER